LAQGCDGACYYANRKEPEIHKGSRLSEFLLQQRRELEIDRSAVINSHQNQEEQNHHEKHRL